jgi:hypothetical protein
MFIGVSNTGYSASFFIPTILTQLGWTAVHAQVMTIPIYIVAAFVTCIFAVCSDIIKHRYAFIILGCVVSIIGYAILLNTRSIAVHIRYRALFFVTSGGFIAQPVTVGWANNNMGGHYKRGRVLLCKSISATLRAWSLVIFTSPRKHRSITQATAFAYR